MQISNILLKLKGYDVDLGKIDTNENNISSNSGLINTNTGSISTNLGLINTNTSSIISNFKKINNIENDIKITDDLYNETFVISNMSTTLRSKIIFSKTINSNFSKNGIFNIITNCNYVYSSKYNFQHIYYFYNNNNNNNELLKNITIDNNKKSNIVKDEFNFESIDFTSMKILIYISGNFDRTRIKLDDNNTIQIIYTEIKLKAGKNIKNIESNLGKIGTNTSDIASNSGLISTNTSSIASNLEKINDLQNSNVKAFYNLDKIFIYDIEKGYQTVDKDNYYHIFEKEIIYNFTKNSYLEIILKVLTEISNYVLIGFFQILCNFYDQDNNLFYTISLSTAAGSINKLSTIKSVFIVPINENISKIKIDFFIAPKATQQNRSANFSIKDINSNKIYIKYFQKRNEMSIKDIQDSLNNVKNISKDLEQINTNKSDITSNLSKIGTNISDIANNLSEIESLKKSIYLKNLLNILYYDVDVKISDIFFEKTYVINAKKTDFLEIQFKILLIYDNISNAKYVNTIFTFYDDNDREVYWTSYDNSDYINDYGTIDLLLRNYIYYTFDRDITNLKIRISFTSTTSGIDITYSSVITDRLIIKHYGN